LYSSGILNGCPQASECAAFAIGQYAPSAAQVPLVHLVARHIQLPLPFFTEDISKVILVEPSYLPDGSDARYSTGCKYPDEKDDNPGHMKSSRIM